jgi:predicted patatin/cPLA2 family phospholipase
MNLERTALIPKESGMRGVYTAVMPFYFRDQNLYLA